MSTYKLTYFDGRARAELIRLIFNVAGVKFIDERVSKEHWKEIGKKNAPIGQLPVLTVNNSVQIVQSLAIARFVANRVNLAGKDDLEKAKADGVVLTSFDLQTIYYSKVHPFKKDPEIKKAFFSKEVPLFLNRFERLAQLYGSKGFSVGDSLKWSDLSLYDSLSVLFFIEMDPKLLQAYPRVLDIYRNVTENPKIIEHVKNRQDTPF